ncbi:MAG: UDP-N-acetylmuramate dehydrogenase [Candidatus Promineifilaceae bacterium]|jgi:UDP-N-acetylmuramate dehydrogenase
MTIDLKALNTIQRKFATAFEGNFQVDVSLARYTSSRVGGPAEMMVTVYNTTELVMAVELAYATNTRYFILGGGSNILVSDQGVSGVVILNRAKEVSYRSAGASIICTAESGVNVSTLARKCISKGLGGLEWAIAVPGTVGGAVVGNSGAFGGDMSDNLMVATILEPGKGVRTWSVDELAYNYRASALKKEQGKLAPRRVVLTAELLLKPESESALRARADAFNEKRKTSQPAGATMGSMFKNPKNYYAGYLIEAAGLKGYRNGGVSISELHANFFVNDGTATAEDIRELMAEAFHVVREKFHVDLDPEVEMVGIWEF